jgi:ribosomal protein S18 acetylase RimI-like enzyme
MNDQVIVRRAERRDLAQVGRLAGDLVQMHHAVDPARFLLVDNVNEGYAWWLGRELARAEAVVLVAEQAGAVIGYAYGTLEERDWNLLVDAHGEVHDVYVAPEARRGGIGRRLTEAVVAALREGGATRLLLSTMVGNDAAQRLFRSCGFRPTMLEMTLS